MWATILPILVKYGIPLAIQLLEKTGALNEAEAYGVKAWIAAKEMHKYYQASDFPDAPPQPTNNNINKG